MVPRFGERAGGTCKSPQSRFVFLVRAMMAQVVMRGEELKIINAIVRSVLILVMNVIAVRNGAVVIFPNNAVKPSPFVLEIVSAEIEAFAVELLLGVVDYDSFHVFALSSPVFIPQEKERWAIPLLGLQVRLWVIP